MSCCPAARQQAIAEIQQNMPGRDGFLLMEYRGEQDTVIIQSRTTETVYVFSPGARKYIDAYDAGAFDLENEKQVFFEVGS